MKLFFSCLFLAIKDYPFYLVSGSIVFILQLLCPMQLESRTTA